MAGRVCAHTRSADVSMIGECNHRAHVGLTPPSKQSYSLDAVLTQTHSECVISCNSRNLTADGRKKNDMDNISEKTPKNPYDFKRERDDFMVCGVSGGVCTSCTVEDTGTGSCSVTMETQDMAAFVLYYWFTMMSTCSY